MCGHVHGRGLGFLELESLTGSCGLSDILLGTEPGPLKEQDTLLIDEPHSPASYAFNYCLPPTFTM